MAGPFQFYFDAATALWNTPMKKLYSMSQGEANDPMKRAADLTLRQKAEFMTPEAFSEERAALTKLTSALANDPLITMDAALKISRTRGSGRGASSSPRPPLKGAPRSRSWKVALWVSVIAATLLLAMDVLATAGVPVPSPIGVLIDRFSSDNPPYLPPEPMRGPDAPGPPVPITGDGVVFDPVTGPRTFSSRPSIRDAGERRRQEAHRKEVKNARRADGRDLHKARGRDVHQARGRDANQAKGKEQHYANRRERPTDGKAIGRTMSRVRAEARRKVRKAVRPTK